MYGKLRHIIGQEQVTIHFQEIIDLEDSGILGYEALCGGPSDSPLHSPSSSSKRPMPMGSSMSWNIWQ